MNTRLIVRTCLAAAMVLVFWGCSEASNQSTPVNPSTMQHPASWAQDHYAEYLKNPASCTPCHGSTTDRTQKGTTGISCFGCHHPNGPHHSANWADPAQHGRLGAMVAANGETGFAGTGFAACTKCHGTQYTNAIGITPSCQQCHTKAPHGVAPWMDGTSPLKPNHDKVDPSNAAECAKCHTGGAHSPSAPTNPAPAGTDPSCFNGTLCHSKA